MSQTKKEHLKSLKQPDQFQVKAMKLVDWLLSNTKVITGIAVVCAVVVVGAYVVNYASERSRNTRLDELGKVQIVFEGEQKKAQDQREALQKQIDALESAAAPKATDVPAADAGVKAAPKEKDPKVTAQTDALKKQVEGVKADHTESTAKFQEFYKKFDSSAEGWMAALTASRLLVDNGKAPEAVPLLTSVLDKSKSNTFYQVQTRLALISVLEDQSEFDKALAEVDSLDKLADKEMKPRILLAKGRIQLLKNQKDAAKATFDSLIEQHGASPEAQKARSIQALFN